MAGKEILPARNSPTATSSAAFKTVGAAPPVSMARRASPSAGNRSRSGASKVSCFTAARSSRAAGPSMRVRPGQAMGDRNAHIGRAELRHDRSIAEFHEPVHHRLRVHQNVNLVGRQREQMVRLNNLKAFVHQRCRVDCDLRTHRPVRMLQRLFRRRRIDCFLRPSSKRSARCRQDHAPDVAPVAGAKRLEHRVVFGVDWQNPGARFCRAPHEQAACADQAFLVGKRHRRPTFDRGKRWLQSDGATDCRHHPIGGALCRFYQCVFARSSFDARARERVFKFTIGGVIRNHRMAGADLARNPAERRRVAARADRTRRDIDRARA